MATLDTRISDLEEEIKGYVAKLNAATTEKELDRFTGLINPRTGTLNRLLDEKKAQSGGKICFHAIHQCVCKRFADIFL
jgi:hypothetical protein